MAGQEGFEPPALGFGVRCSTNWSYWPALFGIQLSLQKTAILQDNASIKLFGFFMRCMRPAKRTIFLQFQLMRNGPFIFRRGIVSLLTIFAGKRNYVSHYIVLVMPLQTLKITQLFR